MVTSGVAVWAGTREGVPADKAAASASIEAKCAAIPTGSRSRPPSCHHSPAPSLRLSPPPFLSILPLIPVFLATARQGARRQSSPPSPPACAQTWRAPRPRCAALATEGKRQIPRANGTPRGQASRADVGGWRTSIAAVGARTRRLHFCSLLSSDGHAFVPSTHPQMTADQRLTGARVCARALRVRPCVRASVCLRSCSRRECAR